MKLQRSAKTVGTFLRHGVVYNKCAVRFDTKCSLQVEIIGLIISGGASPSRQPGHFQVTKVVWQVTLPFFFPPFSSLFTLFHPFLSPPLPFLRSRVLKIQLGGLGERCKLLNGVWGVAPAEIDFGAF